MNFKKIIMIALLLIFIIIIGMLFVKINNKSVERKEEISKDENNLNSVSTSIETANSDASVRKSTEKVEPDANNIIEITDNYFIEQTNDVYLNLNDYIGKTIKMEGLIYSYQDDNGDICYAVVRNTPGCCGSDGLAGLDIRYDGKYPEEDSWVEVVGVMGKDTVYGNVVPAIQITSLKETERGTTFVTNWQYVRYY